MILILGLMLCQWDGMDPSADEQLTLSAQGFRRKLSGSLRNGQGVNGATLRRSDRRALRVPIGLFVSYWPPSLLASKIPIVRFYGSLSV